MHGGRVGDPYSAAFALLGGVVEHRLPAAESQVAPLQAGRAVGVVFAGVAFAADAEQSQLGYPNGAGGDPVAVQDLRARRPQNRCSAAS